jgi:hypothetical protein
MRNAIIAVMISSCSLFAGSAVFADDRGPAIEVPLPIPQVDHDHDRDSYRDDRDMDHRSGCETKTVHKENDQGDSKTVQTQHC